MSMNECWNEYINVYSKYSKILTSNNYLLWYTAETLSGLYSPKCKDLSVNTYQTYMKHKNYKKPSNKNIKVDMKYKNSLRNLWFMVK